jgi:hypothetical protein
VVEQHVVVDDAGVLIHLAAGLGGAELHHAAVVGGLHDAEARVLEEVRPEVEARPDAGLVAAGDPRAAEDHLVLAVVAGRREVVVVGVHAGAGQRVEVVAMPLPDVAEDVVGAAGGRLAGVDGPRRAVGELAVPADLAAEGGAVHAEGRVAAGPGGVAQGVVFGLGGQAAGLAVAGAAPGAVGGGFMGVDLGRPVPGHRDGLEEVRRR